MVSRNFSYEDYLRRGILVRDKDETGERLYQEVGLLMETLKKHNFFHEGYFLCVFFFKVMTLTHLAVKFRQLL